MVTQRGRRLQLKHDGTRWCTGGEWRRNWWMEWVASTLHTTSEHGVSNITTADAYTSAASSWLNWSPSGRFKWTRPFRTEDEIWFPRACAITFQLASTTDLLSSKVVVQKCNPGTLWTELLFADAQIFLILTLVSNVTLNYTYFILNKFSILSLRQIF